MLFVAWSPNFLYLFPPFIEISYDFYYNILNRETGSGLKPLAPSKKVTVSYPEKVHGYFFLCINSYTVIPTAIRLSTNIPIEYMIKTIS